jgi:hypothetical protein
MKKAILKVLALSLLTMSSSFAAVTVLDCHVEGDWGNNLRIQTDKDTAQAISRKGHFINKKAELVSSRMKRYLNVEVNRFAYKNTCMAITEFSAEDFLVENQPCQNKRIFVGEFQGDKVTCVMNSI